MISNKDVCSEIQTQFDLFELGLEHLEPLAKKQMQDHIEDCEHCQKWVSEWELVKLSTRELKQLDVPLTVMSGILSKLDSIEFMVTETSTAASTIGATAAAPVVPITAAAMTAPTLAAPAAPVSAVASASTTAAAANAPTTIGELVNSLPPLMKSDLLIGIAAFVAFLYASMHFGAEGFEGAASWCVSFFILLLMHQLLKTQGEEQHCKV